MQNIELNVRSEPRLEREKERIERIKEQPALNGRQTGLD